MSQVVTGDDPVLQTQGPVEQHSGDMLGWLRAAVLGADDGILSTASLLIGIAAAHGARSSLVISGAAALVAGAMSMAAGGMCRSTPRRPASPSVPQCR